jgi:hypothetical protein
MRGGPFCHTVFYSINEDFPGPVVLPGTFLSAVAVGLMVANTIKVATNSAIIPSITNTQRCILAFHLVAVGACQPHPPDNRSMYTGWITLRSIHDVEARGPQSQTPSLDETKTSLTVDIGLLL